VLYSFESRNLDRDCDCRYTLYAYQTITAVAVEVTFLKLKIGLPKGSLQESTFAMFRKAGWDFRVGNRSYMPICDDEEIEAVLARPQEIPKYVQDGVLDAGLTGKDWIVDNDADVIEVVDLSYNKTTTRPLRVVLAVHECSEMESVRDLEGRRISTEYVNLTKRWLAENGVSAQVEFSWGACEMKVPELADAIVVNTETGNSLRANSLRIMDTLLESTARLIANRDSWEDGWKRGKLEQISMLLTGALNAERLVGLKMNVRKADMDKVTAILPALNRPTLSPLADETWVAVETVINEKTVRDMIPQLRHAGAEGIVEYPLNKVIY